MIFMNRDVHTVYMDSFFPSIGLYEELKQLSSQHKALDGGASLLCMKYRDKKNIFLLSTKHTDNIVETGKVDRRTNKAQKKPAVVHDYNASMNAVDQFDQNMSYYAFNKKTLKWWKQASTRLLHVGKVQCMILYNIKTGRNTTQYEFTVELIKEMTQEIPRLKTPTADPTLPVRKSGRHYPKPILPRATIEQKPIHNATAMCAPSREREREVTFKRKCMSTALKPDMSAEAVGV